MSSGETRAPASAGVNGAGRAEWGTAAGVGLGAFLLYLRTLCPTVYLGDSGEIATAIATGGVAHPPGYPLFSLLGRLALWVLPFGEPAYRLGLLVAALGAGAVTVLYLLARAVGVSRWGAVTGAVVYAAGHTFWSQCVRVEVYSLHVLLAGVALLGAARYRRSGRLGDLLLGALGGGLGLGHHLTIVLVGPAALVLCGSRLWRERGAAGRVLAALGAVLAGPALYGLLMLWARAEPLHNWGYAVTLPNLWLHASGRAYHLFLRPPDLPHLQFAVQRLGGCFLDNFPLLACVLPFLGMVALWKRDRGAAVGIALAALAYLAYNFCYRIPDIAVYYLVAWLAVSVLGAAGLDLVRERLGAAGQRPVLYLGLSALVAGAPLFQNWNACDLSRATWVREFARQKLESVDPNGILVTQGDNDVCPIWYVHDVLKVRPDVFHIDRLVLSGVWRDGWWDPTRWYFRRLQRQGAGAPEELTISPGGDATDSDLLLRRLLEGPLRGRPLCTTFLKQPLVRDEHRLSLFQWTEARGDFRQQGMVLRFWPKGTMPKLPELLALNQSLWERFTLPEVGGIRTDQELVPDHVTDYYAYMLVNTGALYEEAGRRDAAARYYRAAAEVAPNSALPVEALAALEARSGTGNPPAKPQEVGG